MKIKVLGSEITDADINYVSLVKRGANRSPFKIVKGEKVNVDEIVDAVSGAVSDALANIINRAAGAAPADPEALAKADEARLERKLHVLNDKLHDVWESAGVVDRKGQQDRLLAEIEKTETELHALRGSSGGVDFDSPRHSAFHYRGGRSYRSTGGAVKKGDKPLNGPDSIGLRTHGLHGNRLAKGESEDLSDYDDALTLSNFMRNR